MEKKKLKPFVIYTFKNPDTYFAVARAKTKWLDETYGYGWKIEDAPDTKLNSPELNTKRARASVVIRVSNTLNAILMYGKKIFDRDGNISWEQFQLCEHYEAEKKAPKHIGKESFFDKKGNPKIDLNKIKPTDSFKIKEITLEKAIKDNLFDL